VRVHADLITSVCRGVRSVWSFLIGRSGAADTRIAVSRMNRDLERAELLLNCHSMLKSECVTLDMGIFREWTQGFFQPDSASWIRAIWPSSVTQIIRIGSSSTFQACFLSLDNPSREGKKLPGEVGLDCRTSRLQQSRDKLVTFERKANPSLFQGLPPQIILVRVALAILQLCGGRRAQTADGTS